MANVTGVIIPAGVDGEAVRGMMLDDFGIEIGTSFGPLRGKIWRIGTMGYVCRKENVPVCRCACLRLRLVCVSAASVLKPAPDLMPRWRFIGARKRRQKKPRQRNGRPQKKRPFSEARKRAARELDERGSPERRARSLD